MKKKSSDIQNKSSGAGVYWIVIIWAVMFAVVVALYFISQATAKPTAEQPDLIIQSSTYYLITVVIAFASFVMTTLFSFVILNHNKTMRVITEQNQKRNEEAESRGDEFRKLQFIASNYSIVDFTDDMLLYEEYNQYTAALRISKDFSFYLREDNIEMKDVIENFDNYTFLTVKIPFKVAEGKSTTAVRVSRFKFSKGTKDHRFVPCAGGSNTFILQGEQGVTQILAVNLITKKDSDFYSASEVVPFKKIKLNLTMLSMLGVAVTGWIELYFTNPRKLEKNGANQYKINSSQFKISGLPTLVGAIGEDIKNG